MLMPEVERIEEWRGQEVIDPDGEKLGKLAEVFFRSGTDEAVFGAVKHGLLGRKAVMVALAGATLSREYVRVTQTKAEVDAAPTFDDAEGLSATAADTLARHYGLALPPGESSGFESSTSRDARLAAAAESHARAQELHDAGQCKAAEAEQAHARAEAAAAEAKQAEADARANRRAAEEAETKAVEHERGPGAP